MALDDVVFPAETELVYAKPLPDIQKVLLLPGLEITLKRNAERTNKHFETVALIEIIKTLRERFTEHKPDFRAAGWLVIDSSELTLAETVSRILDSTSQPGR